MKYHQKKNSIQTTRCAQEASAATVRDIMARAWKPEASSLKREEWRQIALAQVG